MISYDLHQDPVANLLKSRQGATAFSFVQGDSLSVDIKPCEVLLIDTRHTAAQLTAELERHAGSVRRRIVLNDTQIFGERGKDGGPGLLVALRAFLKANPEWSVIYHTQVNHGLTVISLDKADKPTLPGRITMAANLARPVTAHVADGLQKADAPELQRRLETCSVCELRNDDRCTVCGCQFTGTQFPEISKLLSSGKRGTLQEFEGIAVFPVPTNPRRPQYQVPGADFGQAIP